MYFKLILLIVISMLFCGCGNNNISMSNDKNAKIIIENGDRKIDFENYPERLITLRQHITETALELNLDKYIVGTADIIDPPVPEHLYDRYKALPIIAEKYPTPEVLFAAKPDIIWVDRKWAFVKNQLGPMKNIEDHGIKIYLSESGFHEKNNINYVYDDVRRMGKIFKNEKRAEEVIALMQNKISKIKDKVKNLDRKVKVLDYDSGRNNLAFVGCNCMANELIELAGGINIFNDIDKEWANVSWEEIIKRNPDIIIIHEYRGVSGKSKIDAIKRNKFLQDINAVKNNKFIVVNLDEIYEGVRNAETVEKLAKGFYPQIF